MSAVIDVKPWLRFTATTTGRDKLYRGVQYFSRFLAWYLLRSGASKETVVRFDSLKKTLALSRKLMRIGKPIEHVETAIAATSIKDEINRFFTVGKQLSYAGYLTFDALLFLDGSGAYKFKNIKRYGELANKFWLAGIVFSFLGGVYRTRHIHIRRSVASRGLKNHVESEKSIAVSEVDALNREQHQVNKQLLQDALDMLIPSTGLGYMNLDDGLIGLIGRVRVVEGEQAKGFDYGRVPKSRILLALTGSGIERSIQIYPTVKRGTVPRTECTVEMLTAPGMGDEHVSSFTRDNLPYSRSESRIPASKQRRATGESVHRPNPGQSRLGSSGSSSTSKLTSPPSTPRPIPKSNKKPLQPSSMSSSYTFDDSIDNPFLPSTPPTFTPTFTPTMERTGLTNPGSSKEGSSSSTEIPKQSTTRKPVTPITPVIVDETPPNPSFTRSRDASVSSLPGPRHEDMILPAVARRIKEQGLYDHDVIAYSDDYNAPLYKLPSASSNINHPFASYDREKAASSTSLGRQKSPSLTSNGEDENFNHVLSPSPEIPDSPNKSSAQRGARREETQTQQQQSSEGQSEANGSGAASATSNSTPNVAQPERPRRARRNTNHQTQQEQAASNGEYKPRRPRRPTMPESYDNGNVLGSDNRSQYPDQTSPGQRPDQQFGVNQGEDSDRYQQQPRNDSKGHRQANNEYEHEQNGSPQLGGNNQRRNARAQGRSQQHNDDYELSSKDGYGRQWDAYNGRQGDHGSQQTDSYAQDGGYNHQGNDTRYDARQDRYSTQQGGYNAQKVDYNNQQSGYNAQQGGYNAQQGNNKSQNMGYNNQEEFHNIQQGASDAPHDGYYNGYGDEASHTQTRPDMVQIEMSEIAPGMGGDATRVDAKDNKKKKGAICCVIM
ncbi:Peroxisomal membrane protein PMP27 [Mortierella sp. AM989]|nr:Peroxisomal membrane protein PMP27 [Mortierella sp. AM989]